MTADVWLLGIIFFILVMGFWSIGKQLDRIIALLRQIQRGYKGDDPNA